MKQTGLFDIQSHSYWHTNFNVEKKRLSQVDYDRLVQMQLGVTERVVRRSGDPVLIIRAA